MWEKNAPHPRGVGHDSWITIQDAGLRCNVSWENVPVAPFPSMAKTIEEKESSSIVEETSQFTEAEKKAIKSIASRGGKIVDELAYERFKVRQRNEDDYLLCAHYLRDASGAVLTGLIAASNPKVPFAGLAMERTKGSPKAPDFSKVGTSREMAMAISLAKENSSIEGPKDLKEADALKFITDIKAGIKPKGKKAADKAPPVVDIRAMIISFQDDLSDMDIADLWSLLKSISDKRVRAAKADKKTAKA